MARYADYLAVARLEQLLDDIAPQSEERIAEFLVGAAVSTTFLPRRRQIQITFDLPTDGDDDAE